MLEPIFREIHLDWHMNCLLIQVRALQNGALPLHFPSAGLTTSGRSKGHCDFLPYEVIDLVTGPKLAGGITCNQFMRRGSMRFNIGDKVRHRGLKWLWGTVEEIYEALSAHSDDGRYYLYKVSLKQGNHYIDRGCEWELIPEGEENSEGS